MKKIILSLFIFLMSCAPFIRSSSYGRINLDDYAYTSHFEGNIKAEQHFTLKWCFTDISEAIWMPLTWIDYKVDYLLAEHLFCGFNKDNEGAYRIMHARSVIWHGINSVLLFWIIFTIILWKCPTEKKLKRVLWSLAATAFWALHPLRVESVAWIASRKDLVSMFWLLFSIFVWIKWRINDSRNYGLYALSPFLCVIGAMAKPSVMTYPLLVLIIDIFFLKVVQFPDKAFISRLLRSENAAIKIFLPYIIPFVIALATGLLGTWAQGAGGAMSVTSTVPMWWKILNAITSYGLYILHTLVPYNLVPQREITYPGLPQLFFLTLPITLLALFFFRRKLLSKWNGEDTNAHSDAQNLLLGGLLWYSLAIFPMLGIIGFGVHSSTDRFTYIPAVGFSLALAAAGVSTGFKTAFSRILLSAVFCASTVYSFCAFRQTGFWKNDGTLFSRLLEIDGDNNCSAHLSLGAYKYEYEHDVNAAADHFKRVVDIRPNFIISLGDIYICALCESGRFKEARDGLKIIRDIRWEFLEKTKGQNNPHVSDINEIYMTSRLATFIWDDTLRKEGEKELDEFLLKSPKSRQLNYLKGMARKLSGDIESAKKHWHNVIAPDAIGGSIYVHYRFVSKLLAQLDP